jgi:glutamate decarboxylase
MPRSPARRGGAASIKGDPTMPRHERDFIADRLEDCIFAHHSLWLPVPKYRFPEDEMLPEAAFQVITDELILDDFAAAVAHFGRHPVMVPQTEEEPGSFNHL